VDRPHPGARLGVLGGVLEVARHRAQVALLARLPAQCEDGLPVGVGDDVPERDVRGVRTLLDL